MADNSFHTTVESLFKGMDSFITTKTVVGNTLGLAYGSAVLMDYARQGKLTGTEADLLNYHLAISHSQLEDPLLFAVLGLPVVWLIVPRILLAFIVVWLKRLADFIFPAQAMALSQKI